MSGCRRQLEYDCKESILEEHSLPHLSPQVRIGYTASSTGTGILPCDAVVSQKRVRGER